MQYMLMICHDDDFTPPDEVEPETTAWVDEMTHRGIRTTGVHPPGITPLPSTVAELQPWMTALACCWLR
ncbi:MAG: hypothetical protein M3Z25_00280 [Actinomycetota bacterium]|nr:hypothetical protein [Actinomycetota bacterium]